MPTKDTGRSHPTVNVAWCPIAYLWKDDEVRDSARNEVTRKHDRCYMSVTGGDDIRILTSLSDSVVTLKDDAIRISIVSDNAFC